MLMFQQYLGVQGFNGRNSIKRRPGQGRKRATNAVEDQFLNFTRSGSDLLQRAKVTNSLATVHNQNIHVQTVKNKLQEHQLKPKILPKGPLLSRDHRKVRLEFAQERQMGIQ
jgi:hypothetical protein